MYYKKEPFLNSVADACRILAGWKIWYGNRKNRLTYSNDGVAFTITDDENNQKAKKKE